MAKGGLLILTTTFTGQEKDYFTREFSVDGKRQTVSITQEEFDRCQENGVLPVRYFAPKTIETLCNDYGFHIEKKACYHFTDAGIHSPENDADRNEQGDVQGARDILYLIIKD